jgi:hypothetical protein
VVGCNVEERTEKRDKSSGVLCPRLDVGTCICKVATTHVTLFGRGNQWDGGRRRRIEGSAVPTHDEHLLYIITTVDMQRDADILYAVQSFSITIDS